MRASWRYLTRLLVQLANGASAIGLVGIVDAAGHLIDAEEALRQRVEPAEHSQTVKGASGAAPLGGAIRDDRVMDHAATADSELARGDDADGGQQALVGAASIMGAPPNR
jgi:hypothetical protein